MESTLTVAMRLKITDGPDVKLQMVFPSQTTNTKELRMAIHDQAGTQVDVLMDALDEQIKAAANVAGSLWTAEG